jgi:hypothetical protein
MNHKLLNMISSGAFGASLVSFIAFFMGIYGTTFEGAAILLAASILGFGVARYLQVTAHLLGDVGAKEDGAQSGSAKRFSQKPLD